ncbi:helix-turn-helix domain-containing protein [Streptomyces sp. NPDC090106]|uniref:helix-turn-helix domain-containing protein n=1 Tax=Streptomyces sp. NPDC090106 TaxID=3365946 RepID=UPI00380958AC
MADLTHTLDTLAGLIRRPVALDDARMIPIASTPHHGLIDSSRMQLLLGRPAAPHVRTRLLRDQRINEALHPQRIAPFDGLELGRVYVPVRDRHSTLVGHVWVIDPDATFTGDRLRSFGRTVGNLLAEPAADHARRTGDLGAGTRPEPFKPDTPYRLAVARAVPTGVIDPAAAGQQGFGAALADALSAVAPGLRVSAEIRSDGDVVLTLAGRADALERHRLGPALTRAVAGLGPDTLPAYLVPRLAVSPRCLPEEPESPSVDALRDLLTVSEQRADSPAVRFADDVPAYELLGELRRSLGGQDLQPPSEVRTLLANDRGLALARTVKAFLDTGGNHKRTAESLNVHRGTLYYRLDQASELTGLSLHDGVARLRLHLGLTFAELRGEL